MSEDQKQNIINRLKQLQIEQDELIQQLERLDINKEQNKQKKTSKELKIGDSVIILNPGRFQERSGTVCKIGKLITVESKRGRKIVRARKNIQVVETNDHE
jgi:transcription antitermination factor NusG